MGERYRVFDSFVYDKVRLTLSHDEKPVALTAKALELLDLFLDRPGQVLSKDWIIESLWPGDFVQEGNLSQQVYLLRRTLAAFGAGDMIQTMPRRGYRFAGQVTRTNALPTRATRRGAFRVPTPRAARFTVLLAIAVAALAVAIVLAGDLWHLAAGPHQAATASSLAAHDYSGHSL
jgi:DNA-binding winged helix-turn-helix (wHTH) protein